jgi:hypothetical protein
MKSMMLTKLKIATAVLLVVAGVERDSIPQKPFSK